MRCCAGVTAIVIPAVERANFGVVRDLARRTAGGAYALGIHPLYVERAGEGDGRCARLFSRPLMIRASSPSARSGWISSCLRSPPMPPRERQEHFYAAQLALAAEFGLPVLLHVRKSQDILLKHLRRHGRIGGIAHAFNGSAQQAQAFVDLGFALGMAGP